MEGSTHRPTDEESYRGAMLAPKNIISLSENIKKHSRDKERGKTSSPCAKIKKQG
jgi:hypothetical protein